MVPLEYKSANQSSVMFGSKQRRKLTFISIKPVTKPIKYIFKRLAIANVSQKSLWGSENKFKTVFLNVIRSQLQLQYNHFETDIGCIMLMTIITALELFSTFRKLHVRGMFNDFGC
jgi:hypothetical protein